jgi:hypothetical protein
MTMMLTSGGAEAITYFFRTSKTDLNFLANTIGFSMVSR